MTARDSKTRARKVADKMIKKHGRSAKTIARKKSKDLFAQGNDSLGEFYQLVGNEIRRLARGRSRSNPEHSFIKGDVVEATHDGRRYSKGMKGRVVEVEPAGHHFTNEEGVTIETMGGYAGRTRVTTIPKSHLKLRLRPRRNSGGPRERGGIWLDPPGARDHTSIDHDARDRERQRRRYEEGTLPRQEHWSDRKKVYDVEAVNDDGRTCDMEVLASSPEKAIRLAAEELAKIGDGWEVVEVELQG